MQNNKYINKQTNNKRKMESSNVNQETFIQAQHMKGQRKEFANCN